VAEDRDREGTLRREEVERLGAAVTEGRASNAAGSRRGRPERLRPPTFSRERVPDPGGGSGRGGGSDRDGGAVSIGDDVRREEPSPAAREAYGRLHGRADRPADGRESEDDAWAARFLLTYGEEAAWRAVADLHARLDDRIFAAGRVPPEIAAFRRRLGELAREMAEATARERTAAYREFLRAASHDIRAPLHSIIFLAESLHSSDRAGELESGQRRQVGVIYAAATSLLRLVNDLMDFSRAADLEAEETVSTAFSVTAVASDVRRLVAPLVSHYRCEFGIELETQGRRRGDPQLLCRIVSNLAFNAVRETREEGEVSVRFAEHGDRELEVHVTNEGEIEDLEEVQRFLERTRGPGFADLFLRREEGRLRGLGLGISGRLAATAGGRLTVDHDPPGCTRFRLRIPYPPVGERLG